MNTEQRMWNDSQVFTRSINIGNSSPLSTNQTLVGTPNGDNLLGGSGNDSLYGLGGNDNLDGGSGDDYLEGGSGSDNINGGSGYDTAGFSGLSTSYTIQRNGSAGSVSGPDGLDLFAGIEALKFADKTIYLVPPAPPTELRGIKWHDLNGNGVRDAGELGLSGGTIYIDTNNNAQLDAGERSTTTDANGSFVLTNVGTGIHKLREVLPNSWVQSAPTSGFYNVSLINGGVKTGLDFGSYQPGGIKGSKWNDQNGNGTWDKGESGLPGWKIYLDQNQNGQLDANEQSTTTDASGNYTFPNLVPGTYTVAEEQKDGWKQTYPGTGGTTPSEFQIDLNFIDNSVTPNQKAIFTKAANRWSEIIVGDLPDVITDIGRVDDLAINVSAPVIDGPGNILGQAGPTVLRNGSFLPSRGRMEFDSADIAALEANGQLEDVILHEMGHVLGIGTIWKELGLLKGAGSPDPQFLGSGATAEYNKIFGIAAPSIPVENKGGSGTANAHWRESVFGNELMTGFLNAGVDNPLSRISVASLDDLGYKINLAAADPYSPPTSNLLAPSSSIVGKLVALDVDKTFVRPILEQNQQLNKDTSFTDIDSNVLAQVGINSAGTHTVNVSSGQIVERINFGNTQVNSSRNWGFETGDYKDWKTSGDARIKTDEFGIKPTEGKYQALLTTGLGSKSDAEIESFLGLNPGALDNLGNGNVTEGSAIQLIPITVKAGEELRFNWNFLTNESNPNSGYKDFGFVSITGSNSSKLADSTSRLSRSTTAFGLETDYGTFTHKFETAGTYLVSIGVADVGDTAVDSALLVDNLTLEEPRKFGFEPGDITNWEAKGDVSIQTAEFGISPTEGQYQALIKTSDSSVTDAELETFLGLQTGKLDSLLNGNATQGSALKLQTITVQAGDILKFDWNFLTNELTPGSYNDFGFVAITSNSVSELADTNRNLFRSTSSFGLETGYGTFTYKFDRAGTYTVGIGAVDVGDTAVGSALLIDNLVLA